MSFPPSLSFRLAKERRITHKIEHKTKFVNSWLRSTKIGNEGQRESRREGGREGRKEGSRRRENTYIYDLSILTSAFGQQRRGEGRGEISRGD